MIDNKSVKLAALGDIALGDQSICFGYGVRSMAQTAQYDTLFADIKHVWREFDFVMGNLESVLTSPLPGERSDFFTMMNRGLDEGADALRRAGIGLVSVANNHIFEHGTKVLKRTLANLDRVGIDHVGSKSNPFHVKESKGIRLGFLSWSLLPDVYWPDERPAEYYNVTNDVEDIFREVENVRGGVDRVILSLHWGNEFIQQPSKDQQILAHRLIDGGVDVIVGHHPHVLQPIETYKGGVIIYSLGNFIMDYWDEATMTGAVLKVTIGDKIDYKVHPFTIDRSTYIPVALNPKDMRATRVVNKMSHLEPLEGKEYNDTLYKMRKKYRISLFAHFLKNIYRYDARDLFGLLIWGIKRIIFILSIIKKEKKNPNIVYKGPMK